MSAPDKLSIVVFSGDFERVHYALAMAAAAAAVGTPATLFFTMGALVALRAPAADGKPGWRALPGAERDAELVARGVGGFEELFAACASLGVRLMVCEMGLRAQAMTRAELRSDARFEEGGLVTFFNDASAHGALVFV